MKASVVGGIIGAVFLVLTVILVIVGAETTKTDREQKKYNYQVAYMFAVTFGISAIAFFGGAYWAHRREAAAAVATMARPAVVNARPAVVNARPAVNATMKAGHYSYGRY